MTYAGVGGLLTPEAMMRAVGYEAMDYGEEARGDDPLAMRGILIRYLAPWI